MGALILAVIGLFIAIVVWQEVHPVAGLIVGFLLVGGAGWRMLGALIGLARPTGRRAFGPQGQAFIAAWERRFGVMQPGRDDNLPPPGVFKAWLRANRQSGVDPGAGDVSSSV